MLPALDAIFLTLSNAPLITVPISGSLLVIPEISPPISSIPEFIKSPANCPTELIICDIPSAIAVAASPILGATSLITSPNPLMKSNIVDPKLETASAIDCKP